MTLVQGIGWFVRRSPLADRLLAFYRDGLGLPHLRSYADVRMMWAGDVVTLVSGESGVLTEQDSDPDRSPLVPVFRCTAVDTVAARVVAAGGRVLGDQTHAFGLARYFGDPAGHVLALTAGAPDLAPLALEEVPSLAPGLAGLGWVVRRVAEPVVVAAFYRDGLELAEVEPNVFELGPTVRLVLEPGGKPREVPDDRKRQSNVFNLRVHDIAALVTRLKALGTPFVNERFQDLGHIAYVADPEGQVIGLNQRPPTTTFVENLAAASRT